MSEHERLKSRVRDLERALKPFAKEADNWANFVLDRYRPGVTEPKSNVAYARADFNIGHLRKAKKLLDQ